MDGMWSRRGLLAVLAATVRAADKDDVIPPEVRRFRDSATEFEFTSLTNPKQGNAWLPAPPLRAMSGRSNSLIYASDRDGKVQAWRMDLKSMQSRRLTNAEQMDPQTLSVTPNDRAVLYFDGDRFVQTSGNRTRTIYTTEPGWTHEPVLAVSDDGERAAVLERRDKRFRMRVITVRGGNVSTLLEADQPILYMRLRPRRPAGLVYNFNGALTLVNLDGGASQRLKIAAGTPGDMQWSADGRRLHYLLKPAEPGRAIQLREYLTETGEDKLIGMTTQFISFARNSDSTVFAGVSGSKAAPYLLLLLRAAQRELTIAEHRANDPANARIIFSPNSQRVYWQTDREGRTGIYFMDLERFIEKTEEEESK